MGEVIGVFIAFAGMVGGYWVALLFWTHGVDFEKATFQVENLGVSGRAIYFESCCIYLKAV